MSDARVLAELMGWAECQNKPIFHTDLQHRHCWSPPKGTTKWGKHVAGFPAYDTDLNAMREVWKVLKERVLWDDFIAYWQSKGTFKWDYMKPNEVYDLFNDPTGQIKAAIEVLKEAQG